MEQRLSLVTLGVADLARARAFYEALGYAGWTPAERLDGARVFTDMAELPSLLQSPPS